MTQEQILQAMEHDKEYTTNDLLAITNILRTVIDFQLRKLTYKKMIKRDFNGKCFIYKLVKNE